MMNADQAWFRKVTKMRAFIAIDFPQPMIEKINQIISTCKTQTPEKAIKWVEAENLHLTIKFLGDVSPDQLTAIKTILISECEHRVTFDISLGGLGMYPNHHQPRVLWLRISGGDPLVEIHAGLNRELTKINLPPDAQRLSPHLTIGRIRRQTDVNTVKQIGQTLSQLKVEPVGTIRVDTINLYQSELRPQGPLYTRLLSVPLNQV